MSIVTKNGDLGFTTSFLGKKVKKNSKIIKFSSALDEVVSFLGIAISNLNSIEYISILKIIQKDLLLFSCLKKEDISKRIFEMEEFIYKNEKKIKFEGFILPGDNKNSAIIHYVRALVRKVEIAYIDVFGRKNRDILSYLNRLSDYLFVIAETNVENSLD